MKPLSIVLVVALVAVVVAGVVVRYLPTNPSGSGKDELSGAAATLKDRHRAVRKLGAPLFQKLLRLSWARHHLGDERARPGAAFEAALADAERLAGIAFPLSGRGALALGVSEGPELGRLLDAVEAWWAERDFAPSREDCLERLKELTAAD